MSNPPPVAMEVVVNWEEEGGWERGREVGHWRRREGEGGVTGRQVARRQSDCATERLYNFMQGPSGQVAKLYMCVRVMDMWMALTTSMASSPHTRATANARNSGFGVT